MYEEFDYNTLLSELRSKNSTECSRAVERLLNLSDKRRILVILEKLDQNNDKNIYLTILKNLGRAPKKVAYTIIQWFLFSIVSISLSEIMKPLDKLPQEDQIALCIDVLENHTISSVIIEIISYCKQFHDVAFIPYLLKYLQKDVQEDIAIACIYTLKNIKDSQVVLKLSNVLKNKELSIPVIFNILLTLGKLSSLCKVNYKIIKPFLSHEDEKIRQVAVWNLSKYNIPHVFTLLKKRYFKETKLEVRIEIIKALECFNTIKSIQFLLHISIKGKSKEEEFVAESILLLLSENKRQEVFKKKVKSKNLRLRKTACYHLGKLKDKKNVPLFINILKKDKEDTVRCEAAEALSGYNNAQIVKSLLDVLHGDTISVAYSAVVAICDSPLNNKEEILHKVLSQDNEQMLIVEQTIIAYLPVFFKEYSATQELNDILIKKMHHKDHEIKYLTIQALGAIGDKNNIPALLEILGSDNKLNQKVDQFYLNELQQVIIDVIYNLIRDDFRYLFKVVAKGQANLETVITYINRVDASFDNKYSTLVELMKLCKKENKMDEFCRTVTSNKRTGRNADVYIRLLMNHQLDNQTVEEILKHISNTITCRFPKNLSADLILFYQKCLMENKIYIAQLLMHSLGVIPGIFKLYTREKDDTLKDVLLKTLQTFLWRV